MLRRYCTNLLDVPPLDRNIRCIVLFCKVYNQYRVVVTMLHTGRQRGIMVRLPAEKDFLFTSVHICSDAQATSYSIGNGRAFPEGKVARTRSRPLTPSQCQVKHKWGYTPTHPHAFMAYTGIILPFTPSTAPVIM